MPRTKSYVAKKGNAMKSKKKKMSGRKKMSSKMVKRKRSAY